MIQFKKVVVVGAGTMGQGIAQWFAERNVQVELVDQTQEVIDRGLNQIRNNLEALAKKGKIKTDDYIHISQHLHVRLLDQIDPSADLVIEAIIEDEKIKKELFKKLDQHMKPECILASNTSSLLISSLASSVSELRKKRFMGLHFFNPATLMKLVEVICGVDTDRHMADNVAEWFKQNGKVPCLCSDSPGFIVNRVARNYYGEALRMAKHFDQSKFREIDHVAKEVGGFKMGPFELMDLIGIDINLAVTKSVWKAFYREERFRPHLLQREMVESHRLGKKTKKGFYDYE